MNKVSFDSCLRDTAMILVAPFAGVIFLPLALIGAIFNSIKEKVFAFRVGDQVKDFERYEAGLTEHDITWLKDEESRLDGVIGKDHWIETAKIAAKAIIPLFGYFWVKGEINDLINPNAIEKNAQGIEKALDLYKRKNWCRWHIDLLEGKIDKSSWSYLFGINPNSN